MLEDETGAVLDLLAGPRGRNLCLGVAAAASEPLARALQDHEVATSSGTARYCSIGLGTSERPSAPTPQPVDLETELTRISADAIEAVALPEDLLRQLAGTVDAARYWQPPSSTDLVAARPEVVEALRPIAAALAEAPAAAWWRDGVALDAQYAEVFFDEDAGRFPDLERSDAASDLLFVHQQALATERRCPPLTTALDTVPSGEWWTIPRAFSYEPRRSVRRPSSTRRIGGPGAVRLALMEDSFGPTRALLRRLEVQSGARVFEVHDALAWAHLVGRFPLDVSRSRRRVWWEATGLDVAWFMPDFQAVAAEWDAIHVSVAGYLTCAGRPTPVADGCALLAGWDPDQTYWLNDVTREVGEPEEWRRDPDDATIWSRIR